MPNGISISMKMSLAFAALLAILAGVGFFAVLKLGEVNELSKEMRTRWLPATQLVGDIHAYTSQYRIQQSAHVSTEDPGEKARAEKLMRNGHDAISGLLSDYKPLLASKEQRTLFADLETKWADYGGSVARMTALSRANDPAARDLFDGESLDHFYAIEDDVLQLIELNVKGGSALSTRTEAIYAQARTLLIGAVAGGLLLAVALAAWLMAVVARPVKTMSAAVKELVEGNMNVDIPGLARKDELGSLARALESFKALFAADKQRAQAELERARETEGTINAIGTGLAALAKGDLTHRVTTHATGPLAKLHHDFNDAVTHLSAALSEIISGCNIIKAGTNEIAQASCDLSERTEQQAESLGRAARTIGDFSESVRVAADSARETSSRLSVARESAEKVDATAKRAVVAMRTIESSSKEMTDIISTIDGLAFQTNLLALNAGVEAARAGSAGAGFAVVANEVRHLAQRSAEAASSIRQLVATSGAQITEGVTLVENSGEALRQIVSEVTDISGLMDEIAEAAGKQASGISDISAMVASMDNATQQNAAMVEESTASSRNLSNETARLFDQLAFFDIGHAEGKGAERKGAEKGRRTGSSAPAPTRAASPASAPRAKPMVPATPPRRPAAPPRVQGNLAVKVEDDEWAEF